MPANSVLLQQAFDDWLAHQRIAGRLRRGSSEAVYRAMWQALAAWCTHQQPTLQLADLHGHTLRAFLASRHGMRAADAALTPRYQQRLVSLVQRVQTHQTWRRQQAAAGPAQALALARGSGAMSPSAPNHRARLVAASASDDTPPPLHLLPDESAQLRALLCRADDDAQGRWQRLRDRCAVALQLGAGLGPGDVRSLRLQDLRPDPLPGEWASGMAGPQPTMQAAAPPDNRAPGRPARWHLQVAATGSAAAHAAPLADWAAAVLQRWLALRQAQALGGPWLLPSTRSGKPWGKVAQYEAARRVLADAGLNPDGGGSFRLRHSFALQQLQQGHDPARVASWLGVVDPQVMLRYQQALLPAPTPAPAAQAGAAPSVATLPPWPL